MILRYRGNFYDWDVQNIEQVETITAKYRGASYEIPSLPLKVSSQETLKLKYRGVNYTVSQASKSAAIATVEGRESRHISPEASLLI